MNSIKKFMEIFQTKFSTQSWSEMLALLKECDDQYFENIPANKRGVVLCILFDEKKGLLAFLNYAIEELYRNKNLEGPIIQTLLLLLPIMKNFLDNYQPYVKKTMNILNLALTIKSSHRLKEAAAKTFVEFIKVFRALNLDFNDILIDWVIKFPRFGLPERRLLLNVISVISLYFPQTEAFAKTSRTILCRLIGDYTQTCNERITSGVQRASLYLETLDNLLRNFPPSDEAVNSTIAPRSIYQIIKVVCREDRKNKKVVLTAVNLLFRHSALFDEHIYEDYESWHALLKSFANEESYGDWTVEALKNYYRSMGAVLGRKSSETDKRVFLNLYNTFVKSLSDERSCSDERQLNVYGFSRIIEPCKNYLAEADIKEMFSLIVHRTITLYSREDDAPLGEIAVYQEALSRIIRYSDKVTMDQMRALTTFCSLVMKRYPELSSADQEHAISSLNRTIVNVIHTNEFFHRNFITNIVYDGVVWSCSHMLSIDAELMDDADITVQHPITYKDYVSLWWGLLNPENYSTAKCDHESTANMRKATLQMMVDEFIGTCGRLIESLVISTRDKEDINGCQADNAELSLSNSTAPAAEQLENETDHRIFLNLVDLSVDVLIKVESHLWSPNTFKKFLYSIIKSSYKYPLISGFYKLANVTIVSSGAFDHSHSDKLENDLENLILPYLWDTIEVLPRYPRELQISCLQLVLNIPETLIPRIVDRPLTDAFKISLTLGLTNYQMAITTITALERWYACLLTAAAADAATTDEDERRRNFIVEIVPHLDMYLQSEESSRRLLNDMEEKNDTNTNDDFRLNVNMLQKKILLFLGSLTDNDIMLDYIHQGSLKTGGTWSKKDSLRYPMPFPDVNLDINLDPLLPRIIELAMSSFDRGTRIAACEVLHTLVAFILGKTQQFLAHEDHRFATMYETLCPVILRLACDSDDVVMQLYNPLIIQLTHWLSSRLMIDSCATLRLIDALFDGLCDETDSTLCSVSGVYLAEFVHWSIEQSSDKHSFQYPVPPRNINTIVRRIVDLALDPSPCKRVAAATAFNNMHQVLAENEEIVRVHWLDFTYAFVKSLEGFSDTRLFLSLSHLARVFVEKSRILNDTSSRRKKPPGFEGVTSLDAAVWLFRQCGSSTMDRKCRERCIKMLDTICSTLTVDSCDSTKGLDSTRAVVTSYLSSHDRIEALDAILMGQFKDEYHSATAIRRLSEISRILDLYVWLIRDNLINNQVLLRDSPKRNDLVFGCINGFIVEVLSTADKSTDTRMTSMTLGECLKIKCLRCEMILRLVDFVIALLDFEQEKRYDYERIFHDNFFILIAACLTKPQSIGFDSSNLHISNDVLPEKLEIVVEKMTKSLSVEALERMIGIMENEIGKLSKNLFKLDEPIDRETIMMRENTVKGLIILGKCEFFERSKNLADIAEDVATKITMIFDCLRSKDLGKTICFCPSSELKNYLEHLVELLLLFAADTNHASTTIVEVVVKLATNATTLYRSDLTTTTTHGEYFQSLFGNILTSFFLVDIEKTLNILELSIKESPDRVLGTIQALVVNLHRRRSEYERVKIEKLANILTTKFNILERSVNNLDDRRDVFLNIYGTVARLGEGSIDRHSDAYRWILNELISRKTLNYKTRLLQYFLVYLTNGEKDDNPELATILHSLRNERKLISGCDGITATPETIYFFEILLKLLPTTRSAIVLDAVEYISMGATRILCSTEKLSQHLDDYYKALNEANVLKSLALTYKRFNDSSNMNNQERFDILRYFLLTPLAACSTRTLETFFQQIMPSIYATMVQKPTSNRADREQLFVSMIASYNLAEIMFGKLSRDRINSSDAPIAMSCCEFLNSTDKLSQIIFRCALDVRKLRLIGDDDKEIIRQLHCSAYRCSIAFVSVTKHEKFYLAVFAEDPEKNLLIWDNIIDTEKQYELRQTSKEYPKEREKFVNIRKIVQERKKGEWEKGDNFSYTKSYNLATSTLTENISAYDFNAFNPCKSIKRSEGGDEECIDHENASTISLKLEIDHFNEHECMPMICGLLIRATSNNEMTKSSSEQKSDSKTPPEWMSQFRASMLRTKHSNVRLFMLKIIINSQATFRPWAYCFIEPVINAIYRCLIDNPLNYLVTDALMMLIDWRDIDDGGGVPRTANAQKLARFAFNCIVDKSTLAPIRHIVRYNIGIIEMLVDAWHHCLELPSSLDDRMKVAGDRYAIRLILVFLNNKMADKIIARNDIWDYVERSLIDWKIEEESVLQAYEAAGLMLKATLAESPASNQMQEYDKRKSNIVEIVNGVFRKMQIDNDTRLIKCAHSLCRACPDLATEDIYRFVASSQTRVTVSYGNSNSMCLDIFSLLIPKLSPDDIVKELSHMRFDQLLIDKLQNVGSCANEQLRAVKCLKIIRQLVPLLESSRLLPLVKLASHYADSEVLEYRDICYSLSTRLYDKYISESRGVDAEQEIREIVSTSRRILLSGILDPDENLQKSLLKFWSCNSTELKGDKLAERFLDILDICADAASVPDVEIPDLLQITSLIVLEMTRKSLNYDKKMFEPLKDCRYTNHDISISWRSRNNESRIPLFAPSLVGHLNQRFTQYSCAIGTASFHHNNPSVSATAAATPVHHSSDISRKRITSKRFLADWSIRTAAVRNKSDSKKLSDDHVTRKRSCVKLWRQYRIGDFPDVEMSHSTMLRPMEELAKRDPIVCKYFIVALVRSFMANDNYDMGIEAKTKLTSERLTKILEAVAVTTAMTRSGGERRRNCENVAAAVFELIFNVPELGCPWSVITRVAKNHRLYAQGALLTEQSFINDNEMNKALKMDHNRVLASSSVLSSSSEPPQKIRRLTVATDDCDDFNKSRTQENEPRWIELANLYESMEELDVVLAIFAKSDIFSDKLHSALIARTDNYWSQAYDFYAQAHAVETADSIKRHCLEGSFECLSRLSKWKKLEQDIDSGMRSSRFNFETLLLNNEESSRWIEPWVFRAHIQRILENRGNERFVVAIQEYLRNATTYERLKERCGEECAVILAREKPETSADLLDGSWDDIQREWMRLGPLAISQRSRSIVKLRGINDIYDYLTIVREEGDKRIDNARSLLTRWKYHGPSTVDSDEDQLLAWNIHTSYRLFLSHDLEKIIGQEGGAMVATVDEIHMVRIQQMLRIIECSLNHRNFSLAKRYLLRVEDEKKKITNLEELEENSSLLTLIDRFELEAVRFKFLHADISSANDGCCSVNGDDDSKRLRHTASAWRKAQDILGDDRLTVSGKIQVRRLISDMSFSLVKIASAKPEYFYQVVASAKIVQDTFAKSIDHDNIADSLEHYGFTNLRECCINVDDGAGALSSREIGDCHRRMSKYCYESISGNNGKNIVLLSREFVRSTLGAMSHGYEDHYFPYLLKENLLGVDAETRKMFNDQSSKVETWRFIIWQSQLISHIGTKIMGPIVMPILRRIVDSYPNAIILPLRLAIETTNDRHVDRRSCISDLRNSIPLKRDYDEFYRHMEDIVQPELYIEYHLREYLKNYSINGPTSSIESLMKILYPMDTDMSGGDGGRMLRHNRDIFDRHEQDIRLMTRLRTVREISTKIDGIVANLTESLNKRRCSNELGNYSQRMCKYVGRDIEVPGQYTRASNKRPMPRYHAKIVKIESSVSVMASVRRPVVITIVATDGKNYRFLVKFGEDLRLDQRIQQIFTIINEKFRCDDAASSRFLFIDTYQIFPLKGSLGLIEWIDATKTLGDCVTFSLEEAQIIGLKRIESDYAEWIENGSRMKMATDERGNHRQQHDWMRYKEALVRYSADDVCRKIDEFARYIGWDSLRRTFVCLSSSLESFVTMRRNFTSSYATMCIGQWILGIGDRHLGNTLISVQSGRAIGIDFASAFGGGIDQSVPELAPFRLTPQIEGLLRPFDPYETMGPTMIRALRTMRRAKGSLLACLNIVAEQELDTETEERRLSQLSSHDNLLNTDATWLAAKKVRIVSKKLDGGKPSSIMLEQLAERHSDPRYFSRYTAIVDGTDYEYNTTIKRLTLDQNNLSPEQQVQCLIEQATDFNVLGRMYFGWAPWL